MGGRERRGGRIVPGPRAMFSQSRGGLEELFTATAGGVFRRQDRGREGRHRGKGSGLVFSSLLSSETALEEPFGMAKGG